MKVIVGRTFGVAGVVAALAACSGGSTSIHGGSAGGGGAVGGGAGAGAAGNPNEIVLQFQKQPNRQIDILFVIDDSPSSGPLQNKLAASIPKFVDVLQQLPGGLPDVHVAFISSDLGAGQNLDLPNCQVGGDHGAFQLNVNGPTCATASLNAGQTFISNVGGQANYTGQLSDMISCMLPVGVSGCPFTHPLASMLRALGADGAPAPTQNNDFLRDDAYLYVIFLANEDDCSAPPNSTLFDASSQLVSDPLGPRTTFRCTEFGLLCGGKPPPRGSAADLTGTCVSAEDGRLLRVADAVNALKLTKTDPSHVLVDVIAGPPAPFQIELGPPALTDSSQWPYVAPSCTQPDGTKGLPSVRFNAFAQAFAGNGVFNTDCADSFDPQMTIAANQVTTLFSYPCLPNSFDASRCTVVGRSTDASGKTVDTPLAQCKQPAGTPSCWNVEPGTAATCPGAQVISFSFASGAVGPPSITATCSK
jgi:hypothetical protein